VARGRAHPATLLLDELLQRRVIFVAGKGGSGRTTVSAALALLAVRAGKRVLAIDVDAKGDLAAALGSHPVGFAAHVVQHNLSTLTLQPEESFREYLRVFFKVPGLTRLTPLSRVLNFIATSVPGPRDLLVVGKVAYEERRREKNDRPIWDLIIVDCAASGHVVSHLSAPRTMLGLVRGGAIRSQVQWVEAMVHDPARSTVVLTALPEEMPVVEAIELDARLRSEAGVSISACVLNRATTVAITAPDRRLAEAMASPSHIEAVQAKLGGSPEPILQSLRLAEQLHHRTVQHERQLRAHIAVPVILVPLQTARTGLATSRAVAEVLAEELR
jgi:anion-transporting  ArsA/GET3 family ATPase